MPRNTSSVKVRQQKLVLEKTCKSLSDMKELTSASLFNNLSKDESTRTTFSQIVSNRIMRLNGYSEDGGNITVIVPGEGGKLPNLNPAFTRRRHFFLVVSPSAVSSKCTEFVNVDCAPTGDKVSVIITPEKLTTIDVTPQLIACTMDVDISRIVYNISERMSVKRNKEDAKNRFLIVYDENTSDPKAAAEKIMAKLASSGVNITDLMATLSQQATTPSLF